MSFKEFEKSDAQYMIRLRCAAWAALGVILDDMTHWPNAIAQTIHFIPGEVFVELKKTAGLPEPFDAEKNQVQVDFLAGGSNRSLRFVMRRGLRRNTEDAWIFTNGVYYSGMGDYKVFWFKGGRLVEAQLWAPPLKVEVEENTGLSLDSRGYVYRGSKVGSSSIDTRFIPANREAELAAWREQAGMSGEDHAREYEAERAA